MLHPHVSSLLVTRKKMIPINLKRLSLLHQLELELACCEHFTDWFLRVQLFWPCVREYSFLIQEAEACKSYLEPLNSCLFDPVYFRIKNFKTAMQGLHSYGLKAPPSIP